MLRYNINPCELGSKPLSIFGIAHRFQAETMRKKCLEEYPRISKENLLPEDRGLLALIHDHLIDLDFVDDLDSGTDSPSGSDGYVLAEVDAESARRAFPYAPL